MADTLSPSERSARMALVRSRDTGPERHVRALVRSLGHRYVLQGHSLPGTPDLVFPKAKKVIFVHGCFWHRHPSKRCKLARLPKSRPEFWIPKLEQNRLRDIKNQRAINRLGWRYMVVWECHLHDESDVMKRLGRFLGRQRRDK